MKGSVFILNFILIFNLLIFYILKIFYASFAAMASEARRKCRKFPGKNSSTNLPIFPFIDNFISQKESKY